MSTCTFPKCGQPIPDQPPPPLATPLHLQFCGRAIFTVEGHPGIWCGERDRFSDEQQPGLETRQEPQRGRPCRKTLYRLDSLTDQLKKALGCTP